MQSANELCKKNNFGRIICLLFAPNVWKLMVLSTARERAYISPRIISWETPVSFPLAHSDITQRREWAWGAEFVLAQSQSTAQAGFFSL